MCFSCQSFVVKPLALPFIKIAHDEAHASQPGQSKGEGKAPYDQWSSEEQSFLVYLQAEKY